MVVKGSAASAPGLPLFLLAVNIFGNVLRASGRTFLIKVNRSGSGKIYNFS